MTPKAGRSANADVYAVVTNHIISQLENGIIPWHASFKETGQPKNLISGLPYSGLNVWLLASLGYSQNLFLTWKQVRTLGGMVKRGEKGHMAVYWKAQGTEKVLRYYQLFNIAQCERLPQERIPAVEHIADPIAVCREIVDSYQNGPEVKYDAATIYYTPDTDCIHLPLHEYDIDNERYFAFLFNALAQSTGHVSRLNRKGCMTAKPFGSRTYLMEELVVEMASSFLCSFAGITPAHLVHAQEDITYWLESLYASDSLVIEASIEAGRAIQCILGSKNGTVQELPEVM